MPRILGILLLVDGIAVMIWFLQALLLPDYPAIRYPGLIVSFIAEVGLALWLLIKGVTVARTDQPPEPNRARRSLLDARAPQGPRRSGPPALS